MTPSTNRSPVRRMADTSSLLGLMDFRPRLAVVMVFLTLTVAVVGWRISSDAGSRRIDALAREAVESFAAVPAEEKPPSPLEPAETEKRIFDLSGVQVELPRDEPGFVVLGVRRQVFGKHPAAALRFRFADEAYLLIVLRKDRLLGGQPAPAFPEESFLSGERDGKSYVFWEREGASYIVVSDVDLTRAFEMVRRFFT